MDKMSRSGLLYGLAAYTIWGFLPVFFKFLHTVDSTEIVAQRILWSLVFVLGLVAAVRSGPALRTALRDKRAIGILTLTAAFIAVNWLVYVWAVNNGHVLEASLGYFLNPLVNVALGMIFLKERLGRAQAIAIALAAVGVAVLAAGAGKGLWISLTLAFSFGTYGLLRKVVSVDSLEGLTIETMILAPFALGWLIWMAHVGETHFGDTPGITALLIAGGVITAVPLLCFAAAARRMPYATLGLLQYIAPTLQFLLAITLYGEVLTTAHLICFGCIWAGLVIYAASGIRDARRARVAETV